jgi:FkbM family methyltransferase
MKMQNMKKILLNSEIEIYIPEHAITVINDIWNEQCYTKKYTIKDGDIVIDIGANIGVFSIFAVSQGAKVYAFEPNPESYDILKKNIEENNLGEKIKIFKYAVSDSEGFVDLRIPCSDKIYSLGSATISDNLKKDLYVNQGITFKTIRTETVSLRTIIEKCIDIQKKIDFLKVDCEGAEYDIFNGLDMDTAKCILNVAMETHEGYSEKGLVKLMNERDFILDNYIKRTGHYRTGYCFAHHKNYEDNKKDLNPVAILVISDKCFLNESIVIDARESFIQNDLESELSYLWNIDGETIDETRSSFTYTFSSAGLHFVKCTVKSGSNSDSQENKIIVLENDYFPKKAGYYLSRENKKDKISIKDETLFCIKKEYLPKTWLFDSINISVSFIKPNYNLLNSCLISNGKEFSLNDYYNEVTIDSVNINIDMIFTIKLRGKTKVQVRWWCTIKEVKKKSIENIADEYGCHILNDISTDNYYTINNKESFKILKKYFPEDCLSHILKIGICAVDMEGLNIKLEGVFKYHDYTKALSGWYKEICIKDFKIDNDIIFSIFTKKRHKIKIVWWIE